MRAGLLARRGRGRGAMAKRYGHLACALVVLGLMCGTPPVVRAQVGAATLTGVVTDPSGAPVASAPISVTEASTNGRRTVTSTPDGVYAIPALPPGRYRVEVVVPGFEPFRREAIDLSTGDTVRLDVPLALDSVTEQVEIAAARPALRIERSALGTLFEQERVARLPLNGRTFISLATLAPGVTVPPNSTLPRINGGRPRVNEYLFDGISVLQPEPGQVAYFPIVDSIQEFRIETNSPPAEFGRFNGGVVNLTTKSGTNAVHGTAFEFFRHEALNARNAFQTGSTRRPEYRRNQFGGTFGGPLRRDRLFVFADLQEERQKIARTAISTVPTRLQRDGVFTEPIAGRVPVIYDPDSGTSTRAPFTGNRVPEERIDPVARALLDRYPLPTGAGTSNNYARTGLEAHTQRQWSVRLDQRSPSQQDHVFGRLTTVRDHTDPVTPLPDGSGIVSGSTPGPQRSRAWSFASAYRRAISGTLLHEVRIGDTRRSVRRTAAAVIVEGWPAVAVPGMPSAQFAGMLPTVAVAGYQQLGSPPNTAAAFSTGVVEVADSLTWVRGRHTVKAGFTWRWSRLDIVQPPSPAGAFTFTSLFTDLPGTVGTGASLASFLLGQVQTFSIDLQRTTIQERAHVQEYFAQDDWRAGPRLTLNLGLRYTLNFPSTEINGQTAVFDLQTQQLEYPGDTPVRTLHYGNLGPRVGSVWQATDRTAISAGYGLIWIEMAGITTPFTTPTFPFLQTVTQRTLDNLSPAFLLRNGPSVAPLEPTPRAGLGQGVFAVDRNLDSGYVEQWNVSIQRSVSPTTAAEVAYVGSRITRAGVPDTNLNQLSPGQLSRGSMLTERVPNPFFGSIPRSSSLGEPTIPLAQLLKPYPQYTTVSLYRNNVGSTSYRGITASLRRRTSRGLTYSASYTRSRLIDDASSVFDASVLTGPVANYPVADSFNRRGERDHSTGDIPHVLTASVVWDIPGQGGTQRSMLAAVLLHGWSVAAIATLQSGSPVAITQATNFNEFAGFGVQRPNLVAAASLPAGERTAARWFNTAAFAVAPPFTLGSASRNPVRGPGYRNVDVSLMRRLPAGASRSLDLRAEVFNALNTTNLGAPAGILGAPNFGSIASAFDPRVIQFAARLIF